MHRYEVEVAWSGATTGRKEYSRNHVVFAPGRPPLPSSADPVVGLGDADHWNPELLLVAALSECHMLWYLHLCTEAGIVVTDYRDTAEGTMDNTRFQQVTLRPRVTVTDPAHLDTARDLHARAHQRCFIANSMNFPVAHEPTIVTA